MENRNYQILETIATGGTAVLYKAIQTSLDREVVIKKLHSHLVSDANFRSRFELEAKAAASLDHENIVRIIDSGAARDSYYIVMEYIDGLTLKEILERRGTLDEEEMLIIAREICLGLDHAHQRGIIHRDIKPANIMITRSGQVKITDFGLAKLSQSHLQQTVADTLLGTPLYMSPEQAIGEAVDGRSDLFSLGTICYELVTGSQPFRGETYAAVIQRIINGSIKPPSRLDRSVSPETDSIVMKALSREPSRRFRTALEMARTIESAVGQEKIMHSREKLRRLVSGGSTTTAIRTAAPSRRRRGRRVVPWAAAAVIIATAGAYLYMNPSRLDGIVTGIRSIGSSQPVSPDDNPLISAGSFPGSVPLPGTGSDEADAAKDTAGDRDSSSCEPAEPAAAAALPPADADGGDPAAREKAEPADTALNEAEPEPEPVSSPDKETAGQDTGESAKIKQAPAKGLMEIIVEPEADILVDGVYRYTGNRYGPVEISPGVHSVLCRQRDFREYSERINITKGELSRRRIYLERVTGKIAFDIVPGTRIFVDGKFIGVTPLKNAAELTAGKHLVDLKKAGFRDWSNEVFVPADDTLRLKVTLSPI